MLLRACLFRQTGGAKMTINGNPTDTYPGGFWTLDEIDDCGSTYSKGFPLISEIRTIEAARERSLIVRGAVSALRGADVLSTYRDGKQQ